MEFCLTRKWQYSGGQEGNPEAKCLEAGTVIGRIEVLVGKEVPMDEQMVADAIVRGLARPTKPDDVVARTATVKKKSAPKPAKEVKDE